ncbi:hypothetical protein [Alteribacter populi]|uniref:hypothetical protein n=1 Tax=Alteribacter populi TaxID=2011011 RepID=UPI000BBA62A7|nr:hypothetical protein [Alteribacter populi]
MSNESSFEFLKIAPNEPHITLDKYGRIRLSAKALEKIGIDSAFTPWVAVAYDKASKTFAIQKEELATTAPADAKTKVDRKNYLHIRQTLRDCGIDVPDEYVRYFYAGAVSVKGERFHAFRLDED